MTKRPDVPHYTQGPYEVIDIIKGMMPDFLSPFQGHLWACAVKYLFRFPYKGHPCEDLHKARTYIQWLEDELSKE